MIFIVGIIHIFADMNMTLRIILITIAGILLTGCLPVANEHNNNGHSVESTVYTPASLCECVYYIGQEDLCKERLVYLMESIGMEHPHIVYAQMRLESGNFKSTLATDCNNFFGMMHPRIRENVSLGANSKGYATYDNWAMSVYDYALWQKSYASGLSEKEYLSMLEENYAEDKYYVSKIKRISVNF